MRKRQRIVRGPAPRQSKGRIAEVLIREQRDGQYHWSLLSNRRVMATGYGYSSTPSNARRAFDRVVEILVSGAYEVRGINA